MPRLRTSELVLAMTADLDSAGRFASPRLRVRLAAAAGAAIAGAAVLAILGPRADTWALVGVPAVLKLLVPLLLVVAGTAALGRLARPEGDAALALALLPGMALLGVWLVVELGTVPVAAWRHFAWSGTPLLCVASVAALGLLPLALLLAALRRGAVTRPVASGALAGLVAGASGCAGYALWCPVDSPLYFTLWYLGGTAVLVALGTALGRPALRW